MFLVRNYVDLSRVNLGTSLLLGREFWCRTGRLSASGWIKTTASPKEGRYFVSQKLCDDDDTRLWHACLFWERAYGASSCKQGRGPMRGCSFPWSFSQTSEIGVCFDLSSLCDEWQPVLWSGTLSEGSLHYMRWRNMRHLMLTSANTSHFLEGMGCCGATTTLTWFGVAILCDHFCECFPNWFIPFLIKLLNFACGTQFDGMHAPTPLCVTCMKSFRWRRWKWIKTDFASEPTNNFQQAGSGFCHRDKWHSHETSPTLPHLKIEPARFVLRLKSFNTTCFPSENTAGHDVGQARWIQQKRKQKASNLEKVIQFGTG
jgi:hypothetical protein